MDTSGYWDISNTLLETFNELSDKCAMELIFAEPGKDAGLLPINSLLIEIESLALADAPLPIREGVSRARQWVDAILDTSGVWDIGSLKRLGDWATWTQAALAAAQTKAILPPLPASWDEAFPAATAPALPPAPAAALPATGSGSDEPEAPLEMNIEEDGDLLREFSNESHEHLQNIELGVLKLEDDPKDIATLNSIFRGFHTFKGGSGLLNLVPMYRLAHELENLLELARQEKLAITSEVINLILEGADVLRQFITEINAQLGGQTPPRSVVVVTKPLIAKVRATVMGAGALSATPRSIAAPASATDDSTTSQAPAGAAGRVLAEVPTAPGPAPVPSQAPTPASSAAPSPDRNSGPGAETSTTHANTAGAMVKVNTGKLDSLVDLVGEMVIAQSLVALDPDLLAMESQNLTRNLVQLGRITKELQRTAMSLRMVPIRASFQKMNRLIRDLAARQSKQVVLKLSGEDTELDRTIVEEISDPLIHMVRNSADHGIEMPDVRVKAGKPPCGTIHLSAYHQGGNIVIEIKDDGDGLRKAKILKKAIEKGLAKSGEHLTDKQIFALIFEVGFSTADKVTEISGRGVGMDVVLRNIEKLRGKIEIQSVEGEGTTFSIYLPLTLAIIDGLLVTTGGQRYILPTLSVRESFRPTSEMISSVHERGEMVNVRGRLLPLLRLYQFLGVEPLHSRPEDGIVIVIESGQDARCLMVDELLGKQEVVIKSLGEVFKPSQAVAGAAILGDGRVGLILDVNTLVKLDTGNPTSALAKAA